jgi:hypothetical protein
MRDILQLEQLKQRLILCSGHTKLTERIANIFFNSSALAQRLHPEPHSNQSNSTLTNCTKSAAVNYMKFEKYEESEKMVSLTIVKGEGLPKIDLFRALKPYCVALLGGNRHVPVLVPVILRNICIGCLEKEEKICEGISMQKMSGMGEGFLARGTLCFSICS